MTKKVKVLSEQSFFYKLLRFLGYVVPDIVENVKSKEFKDYGIDIYVGRQGDGKTVSLTDKLDYYRSNFPNAKIYTNYGYKHQTGALSDWKQILELKNGTDGVVFGIDEIHKEFDLYDSRNFNTDLLGLISQQRKQHIKILGTAQVYSDVNVKLRRQTFAVIECRTIFKRWTFQRAFDALEYNKVVDNPDGKKKVTRLWRKNLVQDKNLRNAFDTELVISNMKQLEKGTR